MVVGVVGVLLGASVEVGAGVVLVLDDGATVVVVAAGAIVTVADVTDDVGPVFDALSTTEF